MLTRINFNTNIKYFFYILSNCYMIINPFFAHTLPRVWFLYTEELVANIQFA